jgi:hypothetical protein
MNCNKPLEYILKYIESFPDYHFSEAELIKISKSSFETLKGNNYLHRINIDPEEEPYYDNQGNERFVRKINGQYYGFSTEDSEMGKILLTKEDVTFWSFDINSLLKDIKSRNELTGNTNLINTRVFFIGQKNKIGIFLGLFPDEQQAESELLSLKPKVNKFDILLVLCPSFTLTSQDLLNKLESEFIKCSSFNDAFPNNDFIIDLTILKTPHLPQKSIAIFHTVPGTQWEDVTIQFLSDESIKISANGVSEEFHYTEIGFKDNRKRLIPNSQWVVLRHLALQKGEISWKSKDIKLEDQQKFPKKIERLRERLKTIMQLDDDPFYDYIKVKSYKSKFTIEYPSSTK